MLVGQLPFPGSSPPPDYSMTAGVLWEFKDAGHGEVPLKLQCLMYIRFLEQGTPRSQQSNTRCWTSKTCSNQGCTAAIANLGVHSIIASSTPEPRSCAKCASVGRLLLSSHPSIKPWELQGSQGTPEISTQSFLGCGPG